MTATELRRLDLSELIAHLEQAIAAAKEIIGDRDYVQIDQRGLIRHPLLEFGDFELWPRDFQRGSPTRCHECGQGAMSMMIVRGPFAYETSATERHFCCLHCFWKWVNRAINELDEGGRLDRQMDWGKIDRN